MVVETMEKEHLSIYAAMREFGINDHKIIERWERIYLEEGPEGLSVERRGHSSTGRSRKIRLSPHYNRTSQAQFPPEPQDCPAAYEGAGLSLPCQNEEVSFLQG